MGSILDKKKGGGDLWMTPLGWKDQKGLQVAVASRGSGSHSCNPRRWGREQVQEETSDIEVKDVGCTL